MLFCNHCERAFDEDEGKIVEEHHPYGETYATEEWMGCPYCKSTDIGKAEQCKMCGEWVAETNGEGLCDVCREDKYGKD